MKQKYINAETFEDFKKNQDKLIKILNHSMSEIKNDVKTIAETMFEMKGSFKITQKMVWWIMGMIAAGVGVVTVGVIS